MNLKTIEIASYSEDAIKLFHEVTESFANTIYNNGALMQLLMNPQIKHNHRKQNQVANLLTKKVENLESIGVFFEMGFITILLQ